VADTYLTVASLLAQMCLGMTLAPSRSRTTLQQTMDKITGSKVRRSRWIGQIGTRPSRVNHSMSNGAGILTSARSSHRLASIQGGVIA